MKHTTTKPHVTPTRKKAKTTSIIEPQAAESILIPGLPQDLILDKIASWGGFLNLKDLKTLSMASRALYATMNNEFWRRIAEDEVFAPMYTVKAFAKLKPNARVSRIISKRLCIHCQKIQMRDIQPLRPNHDCLHVCLKCAELPAYAEIKYSVAMAQYKLKRAQLDTIPSRKKAIYRGYNRLFRLCDVLRLVEHAKSQDIEAVDGGVAA
ncbi:Aste57867_8619 [Aphanomyces stellatus]|uniref:Aste57867_8619 protein n=1 Tax=Aphanomyces stellatus TaxID=120398 RepID=A0A485KKT6_9STRA|nr:hypothetical protein As57867_008585 [Aphanomyces stellatus]VFT85505.1 Aste57867_8619 [Aphanomyces stellatus]